MFSFSFIVVEKKNVVCLRPQIAKANRGGRSGDCKKLSWGTGMCSLTLFSLAETEEGPALDLLEHHMGQFPYQK